MGSRSVRGAKRRGVRTVGSLLAVSLLGLALPLSSVGAAAGAPKAARATSAVDEDCSNPLDLRCRLGRLAGPTGFRAGSTRALMRAAQGVEPETCSEGALEGASCGHVEVPLERDDPQSATIPIHFELYGHTGDGPAESVIVMNFGGPNQSNIALRDLAVGLFMPNLEKRDLLLIDDRGEGLSGMLDCPMLNDVLVPGSPFEDYLAAQTACAAQLGSSADDYSTGDVAEDYQDVLTALGYDAVDYHGWSYGGLLGIAFASRYPEMVRSISLDSPTAPMELQPFELGRERVRDMIPNFVDYCEASPTCRSINDDPAADLTALVERIRQQPVSGKGSVAGQRFDVELDERSLLRMMSRPLDFISFGDMAGAASALVNADDSAPLRRMAAEDLVVAFPPDAPSLATVCADIDAPWDWSTPVAVRHATYDAARTALPDDWFAPFTKDAADDHVFDNFGKGCLGWERPSDPTPVLPDNPVFPESPALVVTGQFDAIVPSAVTAQAAGLFPNSSIHEVPQSFHIAWNAQDCPITAANAFIESLEHPAGVCQPPDFFYPAQGDFPKFASSASLAPMNVSPKNEVGARDRRAVAVTVHAATDSLNRSLGFGAGDCLRGGTFVFNFETLELELDRCRISKDVKATGTLTWEPFFVGGNGDLKGPLKLAGPGTSGGTIRIKGPYQDIGPGKRMKVRGQLGGKKVAVSVPGR